MIEKSRKPASENYKERIFSIIEVVEYFPKSGTASTRPPRALTISAPTMLSTV